MKKLKLFLPALLLSLFANSQLQQIKIVSFTVKNQLPSIIDNWTSTPAALIMVAQKVPSPIALRGIRLMVQIKGGGAVVCGNNASTARPVDPFDVRTFNTADLTGLLTNCHELKEGTYTICAQFFNIDKIAISQEVCKDFRVEATNIEYAPPTLITPDNGKKFTAQELQGVVMFRWTPLVPKPKEPVTYRIKVWQLMDGQNGTQAMRSNQPIVSKDVDNITQATATGIYTGPCKPPYLCDFIWNVQALNRAGKPMGNNNGTSEPYTFGVTEVKSKGPDNVFPENNKKFNSTEVGKEIVFRWTTLVPKPSTPVTYRIKVWQLMEGQNGKQAMSTNSPLRTVVVEMDVDQPEMRIQNLYTGPCKPPYLCDFIWNVEVVTRDGTPGAISEPTTFNISEEKGKCPANTFPEDKKKFTSEEAKREMMFRWTPNGPAPGTVHYRIKVWQLMDGQNSTQAMRSNQPIVTKDVDNLTQATVSGIYTGPCKPPYLCDFIWTVEVTDAAGKTSCSSEPTTFSVKEENFQCPTYELPEDEKKFTSEEAKKGILFKWTSNGLPGSGHYRIKVWQLMAGQSGTQAMRSNQPIVTKDVDNITQATVSGIYTGPCKPPYLCDFIWTVEAMGAAGQTGCTSKPAAFSVTEENVKCPANLFPEDKKKFTPEEAKKEMLFRWTAIVPKPQEPVTYRLKVWQLMQGQNSKQAINSNTPLYTLTVGTKDVDNQAAGEGTEVIRNFYTGPCKPPYLCDFVWTVETMNAAGQTGCTSEPTAFRVTEENVKCPTNLFPEDKKKFTPEDAKKEILFRWTPLVPKPSAPVTYRIKVWQLMDGQNGSQAIRSNQPIVSKDVDNLTQASVSGLYTGPCKPPYLCDFIWMVEAVSKDGHTGCLGEPTVFSVTEENVKCPANLFPEDKKRFSSEEAKQSITFKWTKTETPGESSGYRIKVWQLMDGQNSTQAMRSNTPIVTKEVRNATEATVSGIYTGPCKPPYLCDFIWAVEKINASGQTTCSSQPTMFFVTQYIIQLDSIKVSCTSTPGVYSFKYCITNPNAGTAKLITFVATSSTPAGASISSFTPPLNTTINSNGQLCITGTINAATNLSKICIGAEIQDVANSFWKASRDTCIDVLPCKCDACDEKNFMFKAPPPPIKWSNNTISFNQSITITTTPPKTIKSIEAELVYFEMVPENDLCIPCNKDAATYGHFTNGTNSLQWNGPQSNLNISITTPQLVPCCGALFKWCIRYKIVFKDCTTCNKLVCYEKKKDGCEKTGGDNNGPK